MHELSIVEALIEQVERELAHAGQQGRAVRLELSVGRLSGVNPECLRFAFDLLGSETRVAGAEIIIREPKAVCRCRSCNARVEIEGLVVHCPECDSADIAIEGGRDLMLQSIDVED
jgi:hydrogenase nickel incorporation protein HypA/HybF